MTRSSDLVMVEREVLERAHGHLCKIAGTEAWTHNNLDGWQVTPGALREYAESAAKELDRALQSVEGGVQGSIATKQSTNPESCSRTETAGGEPEAWQWRYVGETEWKTPTGGRKLTDEEIKRERRQIEQRPLHYLEQTSSILGQRAADAINDALGGWMYIRRNHGDLYGVGWDRVEAKLKAVLAEDLIARNIPVPDYLYPRSIPSEKPAVAETDADAQRDDGLLSGGGA